MIYLDNNATTKPYESVSGLVSGILSNEFGNPSSTSYELGKSARKIIDEARTNLATLIDCKEDEIIFNSGGTESIYSALLGAARTKKYRNKIYISNVEHPAVLEAALLLAEIFNYKISKIDIQEFFKSSFELNKFDEEILFSVMYANNETGIINPLSKMKKVINNNSFFHSDSVQVIGKLDFSFSKLEIDAISLSAHKFGGPKGIGALVLKDKNPWLPFFTGGGQEKGRRGGTENVPLIAGLGEAAKIAKNHLKNGRQEEVALIRNRFEEIVLNSIRNLKIVGKDLERLPNTTCMLVPDVIATDIVVEAGKKGILISAGSACKTGSFEPSKTLIAMGYTTNESLGMLRISFGFENSLEHCEESARVLIELIKNYQEKTKNKIKKILNG
jgi:cysteine desulfurase